MIKKRYFANVVNGTIHTHTHINTLMHKQIIKKTNYERISNTSFYHHIWLGLRLNTKSLKWNDVKDSTFRSIFSFWWLYNVCMHINRHIFLSLMFFFYVIKYDEFLQKYSHQTKTGKSCILCIYIFILANFIIFQKYIGLHCSYGYGYMSSLVN